MSGVHTPRPNGEFRYMGDWMLEILNITKIFPGVTALDNVSLSIERGEIRGLVGENGAGKSTLAKILMGVYHPDKGKILIHGQEARIRHPSIAQRIYRIGACFQESALVPHLSVAENLWLLDLDKFARRGRIDLSLLNSKAKEILERLHLDIPPTTLIKDLDVAKRKLIEFGRGLAYDFDILILDEITAPLTHEDVELVFREIRTLKSQGKIVIYISHRLEEIFGITDTVTVLKDGAKVGDFITTDVTEDVLIKAMTGKTVKTLFPPRRPTPSKNVAIQLDKVSSKAGDVKGVSFEVRYGEVVALAGLRGQGQREVLRLLFGLEQRGGGTVTVDGQIADIRSPLDAIQKGMVFVSSDAKDNLLPTLSMHANLVFPSLRLRETLGFRRLKEERRTVNELIKKLQIRPPDPDKEVRFLSGGNRRKVSVGKWFPLNARIFLFDDPAIGLDVNAKEELYTLIRRLAEENGAAVILVLTDLLEVLNLPDRVLVMYEGHVCSEFKKSELDEERLVAAFFGSPQLNEEAVQHGDQT